MRRASGWAIVMLALGVLGGLVWLWLAEPAQWEVTEQGIVLTEGAARGQFAVVVTFLLVGALPCAVWGFAAGRSLRELGWRLVPLFVLTAGLASVIAWQVGRTLGPPDPREVNDPQIGDRLPSPLDVDAVAPFLVWPMFALLGLLVAAWLERDADD